MLGLKQSKCGYSLLCLLGALLLPCAATVSGAENAKSKKVAAAPAAPKAAAVSADKAQACSGVLYGGSSLQPNTELAFVTGKSLPKVNDALSKMRKAYEAYIDLGAQMKSAKKEYNSARPVTPGKDIDKLESTFDKKMTQLKKDRTAAMDTFSSTYDGLISLIRLSAVDEKCKGEIFLTKTDSRGAFTVDLASVGAYGIVGLTPISRMHDRATNYVCFVATLTDLSERLTINNSNAFVIDN